MTRSALQSELQERFLLRARRIYAAMRVDPEEVAIARLAMELCQEYLVGFNLAQEIAGGGG